MKPTLLLEVAAVEPLAPSIKGFTLLNSTGGELPAFSPGSHLVLELPVGGRPLRKAYSLTSSPFDRGAYRIAVRLEPQSKGGSRFMHESVGPGMRLEAHTPSNYMHVTQRARRRLFVAGGIGITPFLSFFAMRDWFPGENQLHYAYRSRDDAAFLPELEADLGGRLRGYDSSAGQRLDVRTLLEGQPIGTHLYVCGPARLLDDCLETARDLGWPESLIHFERFSADTDGTPFRARTARGGKTLSVAEDESLLEVLERSGIAVPNLCRAGVCGQCKTRLLGGLADHRDLYLDAAEREPGGYIMPCVSRAQPGSDLELDL